MDVLFQGLSPENFPDLFTLLWLSALIIVIGSVALYVNSGRRFRRYPVLLSMHEWIFWSTVIPWALVFLLLLTGVPLLLLLLVVLPGLGVMLWARFVKFPPLIAAANDELRRRRFTPASKPRPETRERTRPAPAGRRRRHPSRR